MRWAIVTLCLLTSVLAVSLVLPVRAAIINYELGVTIVQEGTPWQGYYTNQDQIRVRIWVVNPTNFTFKGGYLVGQIQAPSKWYVSENFTLPVIEPKKFINFTTTFKPQEPGVYTITLQGLELKSCSMSDFCMTKIQDGFSAINIESVQTYYTELISITGLGGILSAMAAVMLQSRFNRRTLNEMVKQRRAEVAIIMSSRLDFEGDQTTGQRLLLKIKNSGPGAVSKGVVKVVVEGVKGVPKEMKFDIPSLGVGEEEMFHLGIPRSILTGTETVKVTVIAVDVTGEKQNLGTKILGLADL